MMKRLEPHLSKLAKTILQKKLWGIVLIILGYSLLFPALFTVFSKSSINFFLLPALLIGYIYGPVWGAVGGLLFWPLHTLLFAVLNVPYFGNEDGGTHLFLNFWTTYFTTILAAFMVGYLQETRRKLEREIITRKHMTTALRQSEQRYRVLLNHSSNIIVLFDHNGVIEYINPSAEHLVEFTVEELTGRHFSEIVHPDYRMRVNLFYGRQIVKKIHQTSNEFPLVTKSGKTIWVLHSLELLFDRGKVTGGQGVLIDITSRRAAQKAISESEKRFRALTENSSDITMIISKDKIVRYISPSVHHITGFTPEEIEFQDIRHNIHIEDQNKFIQKFQQAVDNPPGSIIKADALKLIHKDGRWMYFSGLITNMLDIESVNGIVFNIREITSQVQLEQALWESEYNFRTLFNQAHDAVVILSIDGKILEFNRRFISLMNLPYEQLASKPLTEFIPAEEIPEFNNQIIKLKNDLQIPLSEIHLVSRDQGQIPFEINLGLVKNSQGEPQKILGILRDISHQKRTEEKLRHLATHDPLTKLPNRNLFYTRLDESCKKALESNYRVAVAFLDCDNFKAINDQYGHHIGDQVLLNISKNIQGILRTHDTLARIGGDEYTIMLEGIQSIENVENIFDKIANAFLDPLEIENYTISQNASIGISIFPDDGSTPEIILKNADKAMYAAKNAPEKNYVFFHQL